MTDFAWTLGAATYAIGAVAFALLLIALLFHWDRRVRGTLALFACAATVAWTGVTAIDYGLDLVVPEVVAALELLRSVTWLIFLGAVLYSGSPRRAWPLAPMYAASLAGVGAVAVLITGAFLLTPSFTGNPHPLLCLALAVIGILLTEILARNTSSDERWMIKFLCLALGGIAG